MKARKGQSVIGLVIAIVTAVVGFVIIDSVESTQAWNSTISTTIGQYIVPVGLLGILGLAAVMAAGR